MSNIAIIPARSGSKGLKNKNIKLLNGIPLLVYSIRAAIESDLFDKIIVSTDSEEYATIARQHGAEVPFLREPELSDDNANIWDVVKDIMNVLKCEGDVYETITLLQPTSPLRTAQDIKNGFEIMINKQANAVVGLCEMDHSLEISNVLPESHSLKGFIRKEFLNANRQNMPVYYRVNGALYIVKSEYLEVSTNLFDEGCYAYIMSKDYSVDIDSLLDFEFAEFLIKRLVQNK